MFNAEHLQEKWAPLLEAEGVDKITDPHRKAVTAVLLENQPTVVTLLVDLVDLVLVLLLLVQLLVLTLF